jgi:hypothetical protein
LVYHPFARILGQGAPVPPHEVQPLQLLREGGKAIRIRVYIQWAYCKYIRLCLIIVK